MITRYYSDWDWENDRGITEADATTSPNSGHAHAIYHKDGRLLRVIVYAGSKQDPSTVVALYDYYCNAQGMVLQKRSYDDNGEIDLVIDYDYSDSQSVFQRAYCLSNGEALVAKVRRDGPKKTS